MVTAVETVRAAISGGELDTRVLEKLSFDPYEADAVRDELVPSLVQLLATRPETAAEVPESLVNVLMRKMSSNEVLEATQTSPESLQNPLVRPLSSKQLTLKARSSESDALTQELSEKALALSLDSDSESVSVALSEKLVTGVPASARKYLPFKQSFSGTAVQQARLMEFNVILSNHGIVPPVEYLCYKDFSLDNDDSPSEMSKIDHVGNLLEYFVKCPDIQQPLHEASYAMTAIYKPDNSSSGSMETTSCKCCLFVESLFLELDAQFLLISTERIASLARIPPHYIVKHHIEVLDDLEVSARTLPAVVNISRSVTGLRRLNIPQSRSLHMNVSSQMEIAAAATGSNEGAEYFETKYKDVLKNVLDAPVNEQTRDAKAMVELNLRVFGSRSNVSHAVPQVHSQSG